ncbi:MAG TPA: hypothetical protein VNN80_05475, partial [Polyangiaceae bacterium]|nr:hypothetical protein [Polyangiaceae bacterium]
MNRLTLASLILAVACKSEPSSTAPGTESPHATPPGAAAPAAHGTNPMAAQTAPRPLEKLANGRVALGPFSMVVPAGWAENPSTSSMRAAQFTLPAAGGDAEVIVYHFGEAG